MKILYLDPIFGISGDMTISALISAGLPFEKLEEVLKKIPLEFPAITPVKMEQGVVNGIHLDIAESRLHLTIAEMKEAVGGASIDEHVKENALHMLEHIIDAESKIHDISREELHLHELAHVDTVIDLVCVAAGIDYFNVDEIYCGPVPCGRGTIKTAHGMIPNPPPVTLEILSGIPIVIYDEPLELTTPTGAAIVRHYASGKANPPPFVAEKIGYGMGTYKSSRPDVLRVFIGDSHGSAAHPGHHHS